MGRLSTGTADVLQPRQHSVLRCAFTCATGLTDHGSCRGDISIDEPKDSYLSTRVWERGYVWVNGHNIGRCVDRTAVVLEADSAESSTEGSPTLFTMRDMEVFAGIGLERVRSRHSLYLPCSCKRAKTTLLCLNWNPSGPVSSNLCQNLTFLGPCFSRC